MANKNDIGFLIKRIHDQVAKNANERLRPFQVTLTQARILEFLQSREGRKTSQKTLEKFLEIAHPTINGLLKRLEAKGFITIQPDEEDKRVKNVSLVSYGDFSFSNQRNEIEDSLVQGMNTKQKEELKRLLGMVYDNVK